MLQQKRTVSRFESFNKFKDLMAEGELEEFDPEMPKMVDDPVRSEPDVEEEGPDYH